MSVSPSAAGLSTDTIVAVATPPGRGGIGVVRLSGPGAPGIAAGIAGAVPPPRHAALRRFRDPSGTVLDEGLVLFFRAPDSYTGEDVVELHAHGAPVVLDGLLAAAAAGGARLARPGEYTERAFLNGRMDLTQAEAVADLIAAGSAAAARSAVRALSGAFSVEIEALATQLAEVRAYIEATIDFADEGDELLAAADVSDRLGALAVGLTELRGRARQGVLLQEGLRVVLAGIPNVGKSSLLNALTRRDAALVTAVPGTTRDVIRESMHIDGLPIVIMDTAGLRASADPVEQLGAARTRETLADADVVLLVTSDQQGITAADLAIFATAPPAAVRICVINKIDLTGRAPGAVTQPDLGEGVAAVAVSATHGDGLDALRSRIRTSIGYDAGEGLFMARRRHLDALDAAMGHVQAAAELVGTPPSTPELAAEELRLAHLALGQITGRYTTEDLLGEIFSRFCIGK